jgi:hypothetical protein
MISTDADQARVTQDIEQIRRELRKLLHPYLVQAEAEGRARSGGLTVIHSLIEEAGEFMKVFIAAAPNPDEDRTLCLAKVRDLALHLSPSSPRPS